MKTRKAFTLIELLVVVAIIALLISILLPSLSRARELSKRLVCASNVKGFGTAVKIYANDNEEHWPTPTFNEAVQTLWLRTTADIGLGHDPAGCAGSIVSGITPNRQGLSDITSTTLSVTRAMWMLVRGGDMTPKSFICPSSGDQIENNQNVDCYYDFRGSKNISYGYQVPYGPFSTRGSEDIDPRMAVMSDSSPYGTDTPATALPLSSSEWGNPADTTGNNPGGLMSPQAWKPFNSPNHGGKGTGEGQNVLFGDGHALFHKNPLQGIDNDNMFTKMDVNATGVARQSGLLPNGLYPGQNTFSATIGDSTTDTLIYP